MTVGLAGGRDVRFCVASRLDERSTAASKGVVCEVEEMGAGIKRAAADCCARARSLAGSIVPLRRRFEGAVFMSKFSCI
ncbi:hypothetical protein BCR44DRAFT_1425009 [Catenaria anguillulae PL171]|uniref:Uncharacterized protein n=1 Tax=Catenaria anguillulae PL171 TaxID=765915 RepID=A0A1Y2I104_9FUNG|nr:hypothetical protein BCR44DRAFT_1425009 [Catenaria anguillulae PL171]